MCLRCHNDLTQSESCEDAWRTFALESRGRHGAARLCKDVWRVSSERVFMFGRSTLRVNGSPRWGVARRAAPSATGSEFLFKGVLQPIDICSISKT